ncbi:putative glycosyltransferase EpsJ [Rubripirellula lacrimiformis]|uniref:Putative glycosyltransferase EpsJ n=1 Tax=Rubripirellula lacrimiformis TaxID=1930273 RepID=A0A517N8Q9_9BACT|nr:glycosyltransferase family 2 protein [Rubripirellula lacrimiformis]QDT03526.1 putative glycosyltransferase EpsJ [Rubripirellula lacrimiformis]
MRGSESLPTVSVITPCFNAANTIDRMITSVRASSSIAIEIIAIDDFSTDTTIERLRQFTDDKMVIIAQPENCGPSACRNRGIDAAKGDWIAMVDSDDWISPDRLGRMIDVAEANGLDVIGDNQWVCNPAHNSKRKRMGWLDQIETSPNADDLITIGMQQLIKHTGLGIIQPLIRRSFLEQEPIRYRTEFRYGEDYHFLFDLMIAGASLGVIDEPMYFAEINQSGLTSNRVQMFAGMVEVLQSIRQLVAGTPHQLLSKEIDEAIAMCRKTIQYGAVMDPLKSGRILHALGALASNPGFIKQAPGRVWGMLTGRTQAPPRK